MSAPTCIVGNDFDAGRRRLEGVEHNKRDPGPHAAQHAQYAFDGILHEYEGALVGGKGTEEAVKGGQ